MEQSEITKLAKSLATEVLEQFERRYPSLSTWGTQQGHEQAIKTGSQSQGTQHNSPSGR